MNGTTAPVVFTAPAGSVVVEVPNDGVAADVRRLFPSYADRGRGESPVVRLRIEESGGEYRLTGGDPALEAAWTSLPLLRDELEFRVAIALLGAHPDALAVHASGVRQPAGTLLAFGPSGSGKSTIACAASLAGRAVFGDDIVLVLTGGRIAPFRRLFKVAPVAVAAAGGDASATPFWDAEDDEAWFDPDDHGGWAEPARPDVLVFLERRSSSGAPSADPVRGSDAVRRMLGAVVRESATPLAAAFDRLADLADAATAMAVRFSHPADLPAYLNRHAESWINRRES